MVLKRLKLLILLNVEKKLNNFYRNYMTKIVIFFLEALNIFLVHVINFFFILVLLNLVFLIYNLCNIQFYLALVPLATWLS